MVFTTSLEESMKIIVNTILLLIFDVNSLKVPKNKMFYDFSILAGACGSQWRALAIVCKTCVFFCVFWDSYTLIIYLIEFYWYLQLFSLLCVTK